jgi:hypothetical protein
MTKDQENIEKEPSTGGKAVRGFGYVLLGIGVFGVVSNLYHRSSKKPIGISSSDTSTVHSIQLAVNARRSYK